MSGRLSVKSVLRAVSDVTGVSVRDILSPHRQQSLVRARHIAMWMARRHCSHLSYPEIARRFAGRDHTSILHGVNKIEAEIADVGMDREMEEIDLVLVSTRRAMEGLSIDDDELDPLEIAGRAMTDHGVSRITFAEIRCLAAFVIEREADPEPDNNQPTAVLAVPVLPGADALIGAARRVVRAQRDLQIARYGRGEAAATTILTAAIKELQEAYLDLAAPAVFNPASNAPRKETLHG
jgi:hypothetical protein